MPYLIIATRNSSKYQEILQIFDSRINVTSMADFPEIPKILEDGDTFESNAIKKARYVARYTGLPALADDSGLEVDALNGAPGIYSARFSGKNATSKTNNTKLLYLLRGIPKDKRTARFRCAIAFVTACETIYKIERCCEGRILYKPKGTEGFGYDPLFFFSKLGLTFSELSTQEKNQISHRGKALRAMRPFILQSLLGVRT